MRGPLPEIDGIKLPEDMRYYLPWRWSRQRQWYLESQGGGGPHNAVLILDREMMSSDG